MDSAEMLCAVKSSREYGMICEDTIRRVINDLVPRYKNAKLALKAVKSALREISAAFLSDAGYKDAERLVNDTDWADSADVLSKTQRVLTLHKSTAERIHHYGAMISDIRSVTGFNSVLDIGCGLFPFIIPHTRCLKGALYYAADIHCGAVKLVNALFHGLGVQGQAFAADILTAVPTVSADCVFMFKLLPLLERVRKDASAGVLAELNARYAAISFPTRSLTGRNVGMKASYAAFVNGALSGFEAIYEKEYANEVLYILRLGKEG